MKRKLYFKSWNNYYTQSISISARFGDSFQYPKNSVCWNNSTTCQLQSLVKIMLCFWGLVSLEFSLNSNTSLLLSWRVLEVLMSLIANTCFRAHGASLIVKCSHRDSGTSNCSLILPNYMSDEENSIHITLKLKPNIRKRFSP